MARVHWHKPPLFVLAFALFVLAISLMKEGAGDIGPIVRDRLHVGGFVDALGFGWLASYLVMSGSPVAGVAMVFLDRGVLDSLGAYGMIVGSRFGASFIVLFLGFLYVVRGQSRTTSLSMGVLSMSVAATIQILAIPVGLLLLSTGVLDGLSFTAAAGITDFVEVLTEPVVAALGQRLPAWGMFVTGLGLIMTSFSLFDRSVPEMTLKESGVGSVARFVYRPWVMFGLGVAVTLATMSVSISLGLLVPLSQRGLVRRENVIPYIMGANISTFVDTLLAALLIGNPEAFTVVMVEMASLMVVAALLLTLRYEDYERATLHVVQWITERTRNIGLFLVVICAIPILLLVVA